MTKIILATGGRSFKETPDFRDAFEVQLRGTDALFHGGCRGFDIFAGRVAKVLDVPAHVVPALWGVDGRKKGGLTRNDRMLKWALQLAEEIGATLVCVAGPGSTGTRHMMRAAWKAGIEVVQLKPTKESKS